MGTTVVNGVTFVNAAGAVSIKDIQAAFGGSNQSSLSAFRSRKWYASDFSRGTTSASSLTFASFRGRGGNIPRVNRAQYPASGIFYGSGPISIPKFNTLRIQVYASGGGGGGGNAAYFGGAFNGTTIAGGAGSAGGNTSVSLPTGTFTATGGGGGNNGSNGANGGPSTNASTAAGGTGNGNGGRGGFTEYIINADDNYATASLLYDKSYTPTYGAAGAGGAGANGLTWNGAAYVFSGINGANGGNGVAGGVTVFVDLGLY